MTTQPQQTCPKAEEYAPYHKMPAFVHGFIAESQGKYDEPELADGVDQQAYDRGMEFSMRIRRYRESRNEPAPTFSTLA
jgi:hypothetical protein